jgi:mono/diheme cytochrome c family protein
MCHTAALYAAPNHSAARSCHQRSDVRLCAVRSRCSSARIPAERPCLWKESSETMTSRARTTPASRTILIAVFLLSVVGIVAATLVRQRQAGSADATDRQLVALGQQVYAANCASCHGANLQGQPDWTKPLADGSMPAPPHDPTGHTWHHNDALLFTITSEGGAAAAGDRKPNGMPAFGSRLSEREIWAVLAYIKSTWPPEVRAAQQRAR